MLKQIFYPFWSILFYVIGKRNTYNLMVFVHKITVMELKRAEARVLKLQQEVKELEEIIN